MQSWGHRSEAFSFSILVFKGGGVGMGVEEDTPVHTSFQHTEAEAGGSL